MLRNAGFEIRTGNFNFVWCREILCTVLYLRVSSFGTFIGYFRGIVTARDRCANADCTVNFLRTIGTKPIVKLIESDLIIFRNNLFNLEI